MNVWVKTLILWFGVLIIGNVMIDMLLPVLVPGILIFSYVQDRQTLHSILKERGTKIGLIIFSIIAFIFIVIGLFQDALDFFGIVLSILFVASWPCARYIVEKLSKFIHPSKSRPDVLSSDPIKTAIKDYCKKSNTNVFCGEVNQEPLYLGSDDRAVVIGPPGTGKTAFLVTQVLEWIDQGYPFVVNDIKPEIYGIVRHKLETAGYKIITYNPTAGTGFRYNPFSDVNSVESMGELVATFLPSMQQEDKIFSETARDLLDGIVTHLKTKSDAITLPLIRDFLGDCNGHEALLKVLAESPDKEARHIARSLGISSKNERFLGSVMATLNANLRFLRYPNIRESLIRSDFSLSEFCQAGNKVALFLQFEEVHQEITSLLFSAMMSHLMRFFIEHSHRPPVLLLLDEIGNVPPVAGLIKKLNTIRSRNLPTWLYFQGKEQMQRYGSKSDEGANIILGACDFQMVLRLNDNATANWMSEKIGTIDRLNTAVNIISLFAHNISRSLIREPIIFPHALQQLPNGQGVASYRGVSWRNEAIPYYQRWPEFNGLKLSAQECRQASYSSSKEELYQS